MPACSLHSTVLTFFKLIIAWLLSCLPLYLPLSLVSFPEPSSLPRIFPLTFLFLSYLPPLPSSLSQATAQSNGVEGVRILSKQEAQGMEPSLHCEAALWSPETGIVDSHSLMTALQVGGYGADPKP